MNRHPHIIDYSVRREARAAFRGRWLASFSFVLLLVSAAGHRYGLVETTSFFWLLGIVLVLALFALLLAWIGLVQVWEYGMRGGRAGMSAMFLSLLTLLPFVLAGYGYLANPALADISTDFAEPPRFERLARQREAAMNPVPARFSEDTAALQRAAYPLVAARRYNAGLAQVEAALATVAEAYGWELMRVGSANRPGIAEFEAEAPSDILRLPADAALRLMERPNGVIVDMRLSSRFGTHDLGMNARRIAGFMADLDGEVTALLLMPDLSVEEEEDEPVLSGGEEDAAE